MKNITIRSIIYISLLLLLAPSAAWAQIDLRTYAQDDLFTVKRTITEETLSEDKALKNEEEHNTFIQEEINKGLKFVEDGEYEDALAHFEQMNEEYQRIAYFPYVIGSIHYQKNHLADAQASYEKALQIDPLFLDARYMLGMVALDSGDLRTAGKHFDILSEIPEFTAKSLYGKGLLALKNYNYYKALSLFRTCIETDPSILEAYEYVLIEDLTTNRLKHARATIEKGIEAVPDWEQGIIIHGLIAVMQDEDNVHILENDINTLISLSPDNYHYYSMQGFLSMELKKYHEAIRMFKEALTLSIDSEGKGAYKFNSKLIKDESYLRGLNYYFEHYALNPEVRTHLDKGICYLMAGKKETALKYLDSANQVEPTSVAYYFKGAVYKSYDKKHKESIAAFSEAVALDSTFWTAYSYRAAEYMKTDSAQSAYEDYTQVIKLQPKVKEGHKNRAHILYLSKSYLQAYKDYSRALSIDPSDHDLYFNRGSIAYILNQYPQAIIDFKTILKEVKDGESYYMVHKCYLALNDSLQALTYLDSASNKLKYSENYHLELNDLASKLNKIDYQINAFDRLVKYFPYKTKFLYTRAKIKYEAARYDAAIIDLEKLIKKSPQWAEIYYLLGKSYEHQGDAKNAEKNISKSRRLGYILNN